MRETQSEIVVVGAGPAGIAAACCAAENAAQVLVLDDNVSPGGQIWRHKTDTKAQHWTHRLQASKTVRVLPQTRVLGLIEAGLLLAEREGEAWFIRYSTLILATGARELMLPFPGWTLPGVAGAGGLQALVEGGLPIAGKRVVVAGSGPLLLAVAAHLQERGAHIQALVEQTPFDRVAKFAIRLGLGKLLQAAHFGWQLRGVPILYSAWPIEAQGERQVSALRVQTTRGVHVFDCDYAACGFGLVPNTELAQLAGCELRDGFVAVDEQQQTSVHGVFCAGEPTGIGGLESSLIEGQLAGYAAAGKNRRSLIVAHAQTVRFSRHMARAFRLRSGLNTMCLPNTLVCRCEDVAWEQISRHSEWRSAKLQTRCGMGPCQGRICGPAIEFLTSGCIRAQSVRAPLFPASMDTLASSPSAEEQPV